MLQYQVSLQLNIEITEVEGFNGINDHWDKRVIHFLEPFGSFHIDSRKPAPVAGMRVIPADNVMGVDIGSPFSVAYAIK